LSATQARPPLGGQALQAGVEGQQQGGGGRWLKGGRQRRCRIRGRASWPARRRSSGFSAAEAQDRPPWCLGLTLLNGADPIEQGC